MLLLTVDTAIGDDTENFNNYSIYESGLFDCKIVPSGNSSESFMIILSPTGAVRTRFFFPTFHFEFPRRAVDQFYIASRQLHTCTIKMHTLEEIPFRYHHARNRTIIQLVRRLFTIMRIFEDNDGVIRRSPGTCRYYYSNTSVPIDCSKD